MLQWPTRMLRARRDIVCKVDSLDPRHMELAQFVENMRNNALQRVQLAMDLFKKHSDGEFERQALMARGEVLAFEAMLQRLRSQASSSDRELQGV
jgi:hypothetical protein